MKKVFLLLIALLISSLLYAQNVIEFYGTQSASADAEMIGMTTDLYYNQLQNTKGYSIVDKRDSSYNSITKTKTGISFYAQIEHSDEDESLWTCTLHAIDGQNEKESSLVKNYESYYKILLDARMSINTLLSKLHEPASSGSKETNVPLDIKDLYGTWDAENSVNKIVIMQDSKGFVIYDNGSSMNVSISVDGSDITVRQIVSSGNKENIYPTTWKLSKSQNGVLKGKKISGESSTDVEWIKR